MFQLRIKIECAFGMLVKHWGILRKALPATMPLDKIVALVICLCRLHNYCVNVSLAKKSGPSVPSPLATDSLDIVATSGISLQNSAQGPPEDLAHGGEHHDDAGEEYRCQFQRRGLSLYNELPREKLLRVVREGGFQRPTPKNWVKIQSNIALGFGCLHM